MMRVLAVLDERAGTGPNQLAVLVGEPKRTIQRDLAFLKEKQMVKFVGARKTGGYEITDAGRKEVRERLA